MSLPGLGIPHSVSAVILTINSEGHIINQNITDTGEMFSRKARNFVTL